jgi:DNA repair protein RadC
MADVVIREPLELLVEQSLGGTSIRKNPRRPLSPGELVAATLYGGYGHLLVRTASVRAESFDEKELPRIGGFDDVVRVASHLREATEHRFLAMLVDGRNRVLGIYENQGGFHDGNLRDLVRAPFLVSSRAAVFCHNHPEGGKEPTEMDIRRTRELARILDSTNMTLLDHVILAPEGDFSMLERGLLRNL